MVHTKTGPTVTELKLDTPAAPVIRCEGYLSKYSSGSIGRWQRRYFVLYNGRFGYYKKAPSSTAETRPDKSFSLRKIKAVFTKDSNPSPNEREFTIKLGDHTYQLKASTPTDMRKWYSALSTALAHRESFPMSEEDDEDAGGSSSAADMISVSNSVSSQVSDVSAMNEDVQAYLHNQRAMAASAAKQHETVWEVDLDPDELDKLFDSWFGKIDSSTVADYAASLVKGLTTAISHLYSTLASEIFDAEVTDLASQFTRAKSVMQSVRKSTRQPEVTHSVRPQEDPIRTQLNSVLMEYVPRIIIEVGKFLDKRKVIRENDEEEEGVKDLLGVIDILALVTEDISSLSAKPECLCAYCSPSRAVVGASDTCMASERWKKNLRNCLQRLGSEFEVGLIEAIQSQMLPSETTWDATAGDLDSGPCKTTHPLLGTRSSVWLTAWSATLITACQEEGVDLIRAETTQLKHSNRLVSELIASVLVAVLNSAWRQFKRRCVRVAEFADQRKRVLKEIADLHASNVGFWSVFSNQQTLATIAQLEKQIPPEEINSLELPNLLAFGNEAVLLSLFQTENLTEQLPYIPPIFDSCFDGLGLAFTNTAIETGTHIVHFFFVEKSYSEVEKAFATKNLQTDISRTPMIVCKDFTERFVADLVPYGAHATLKVHMVNLLPNAVIHLYVSGLLKSRPRVKTVKTLASIIDSDLNIFRALFSDQRFNCKDAVVNRAIAPLTAVQAFLFEEKKPVVIEETSKKLLAAFGAKFAPPVANILLEMRGNDFYKSERTALMAIVDPNNLLQATTAPAQTSERPGMSRGESMTYMGEGDSSWRF